MPRLLILTALLASASPVLAQAKQSIAIGDITVSEEAGKAIIPIRRVGPFRNNVANFRLQLGATGDTAKSGLDYPSSAMGPVDLAIQPGQNVFNYEFPLINDTVPENTEFLTSKITALSGSRLYDGTGKITITDSDVTAPTPVVCPDGSTVIPPATCPAVQPPTTTPGDIPVPSLDGLPPIVSFVDPSGGLETWSYEHKSASPDVVGAVRLTCGFAGVGRFDPKVYPGDHTGKSHLHQFYSNTGITPDTTYESGRTTGKSTCNYGDTPLQRSAYWQPAMFDGKGNVVQPDHITLYYKRRPMTDPVVSDPTNPKYQGKAVDMPNGIFWIFGYDMLTGTPPTGEVDFACFPADGSAAIVSKASEGAIKTIADSGRCTTGSQFATRGHSPSCWDGKRADSANHRAHMSYPQYGTWGYLKCDKDHPYVIPTVTLLSSWIIRDGDDIRLWSLSSDMDKTKPPGYSFHADIWPLWEPAVLKRAERGCMDLLLNCSGGRLDETTALKNAGQPQYPDSTGKLIKSWYNTRRTIPIPGPEANDKLVGFTY